MKNISRCRLRIYCLQVRRLEVTPVLSVCHDIIQTCGMTIVTLSASQSQCLSQLSESLVKSLV